MYMLFFDHASTDAKRADKAVKRIKEANGDIPLDFHVKTNYTGLLGVENVLLDKPIEESPYDGFVINFAGERADEAIAAAQLHCEAKGIPENRIFALSPGSVPQGFEPGLTWIPIDRTGHVNMNDAATIVDRIKSVYGPE